MAGNARRWFVHFGFVVVEVVLLAVAVVPEAELPCATATVLLRLAGSRRRDKFAKGVTKSRANHGVAQTLIMSRNGRNALVMAYAVAKLSVVISSHTSESMALGIN